MRVDHQYIAAARFLETRGFSFSSEHGWRGPEPGSEVFAVADAMLALLVRRACILASCLGGIAEEEELAAIRNVARTYSALRRPSGGIEASEAG